MRSITMEASGKSVPTKRRRAKRPKAAQKYEHFFVHVESWDHYYGFGPGDPLFDATPYRHTETLTWTGRVILPEGFKYPRAVVTLSAQQGLLAHDAEQKSIGSNYARNVILGSDSWIPEKSVLNSRRTQPTSCPLLSNNGQIVAVPRMSAKCH
jgi:hypothetical protein